MVDRDHDRIRDTERTTVVHTDGGRGRGRGLLLAVILLLLVGLLLFFVVGGNINRAADEVGVNVDVDVPDVKAPNIEVPDVKVPDVNMPDVRVPEVDAPDINVNLDDVRVDANDKEEPKR